MKIGLDQSKFLLVLSISFVFFSCKFEVKEDTYELEIYNEIQEHLKARDYFTARELVSSHSGNLSEFQLLEFEVILDNIFNKPESSNAKINTLRNKYSSSLTDSTNFVLIKTSLENHIKLYEYDEAAHATKNLLANFSHYLNEEKVTSHRNMLIIWEALADQPKQKITVQGLTNIPVVIDKAGLKNLEVKKDSIKIPFIFDTGANFSTITQSIAQQFDLEVLDGNFEVNSITGQKINSKIAIAPLIFLGNIKIENAVFLIFPDASLAFPQITYQINGILGLPVIEALGEIQFTRDNRFMVPDIHSQSEEKNLALDFLTPLILLRDETGTGTYTFDTGAVKTMLYNTYFERYNAIKDSLPEEVDYTFAGAGGSTTSRGIYINYSPEVNGKPTKIDSVIVLKAPIHPNNYHLGNIGQDLIGQFDKITINFEQMFIKFD